MNLRFKTILILFIIFITFILSIYFFSFRIIFSGFEELEREDAIRNINILENALSNEINYIDSTTYDWAAWNDTYEFIEFPNEEYIESNLVDSTFVALRINVMLFFNSSNALVYGKAFDLENETEIPIPQQLLEYIEQNDFLLNHKSINSSIVGIIAIDNPMIISSRPILTSEDKGPIRGTLIMACYLKPIINEIAQLFNFSISFVKDQNEFLIQTNENTLYAYYPLKDIKNETAFSIKLTMSRDIYKQGKITVHYFVISFLIAALLICIIAIFLIDKFVTSRIIKLYTDIDEIAESGNIKKRTFIGGDDELKRLSITINRMLDTLEKTFEKEKRFRLRTAHYFLNPIAIAKGYLQLAIEERNINYIGKAINAIERIEKVIKNVIEKGEIKE